MGSDQRTFISKALSPARVSQVYLEDHPDEGKTAVVIVPDDQLSLAIGREGQNARLAAKLTGWRIDIKSLTEAATDSLARLNDPAADKRVARDKELVEKVQHVLAKKEASRPITAEDYMVLDRFVAGVEGRIIAERAVSHEQLRKERVAARKRVPKQAWDLELEELDLPLRLHNLLLEHEIVSVGDVMYHLEIGDASLLAIDGVGDKALEVIKEAMAELQQQLAVAPRPGQWPKPRRWRLQQRPPLWSWPSPKPRKRLRQNWLKRLRKSLPPKNRHRPKNSQWKKRSLKLRNCPQKRCCCQAWKSPSTTCRRHWCPPNRRSSRSRKRRWLLWRAPVRWKKRLTGMKRPDVHTKASSWSSMRTMAG